MDDVRAKRIIERGVWRGQRMLHTAAVEGRACDGCSVCCVALVIRDPELSKRDGVPCDHLVAGGGCGVYTDRPMTCRHFHCGWQMLNWVHPNLRPDTSGVLVRLGAARDRRRGGELEVVVTILRPEALEVEGLAETVAAAIMAGRSVHLEATGAPGSPSGLVELNDGLIAPVLAQDRAETLRRLRQAYGEALTFGAKAKARR